LRYLKWAAVGLVPMLVGAAWLRTSLVRERDRFVAFCSATRRAEPWDAVEARAARGGWAVVPQSPAAAEPRAYLVSADVLGYRLGCTVVVRDGRVVEARASELPDD
jgi:hypothetical protein